MKKFNPAATTSTVDSSRNMEDAKLLLVVNHFEELRRRILLSVFIIVFVSVVSYPLSPLILNRIKSDLLSGISFVVLSPLEAVTVNIKVSILLSLVFSSPLLFYELWSFIGPGLSRNEKKMLLYAIMPSTLLFIAGILFAYKIILPVALYFLVQESYSVATPMFSLNETFSFIMFTLVSTGLAFQLPLIIAVLCKIGLVNHELLRSNRKYFIVIVFVFAGVITPDTTIVSQMLVALPLILLYELSILASRIIMPN